MGEGVRTMTRVDDRRGAAPGGWIALADGSGRPRQPGRPVPSVGRVIARALLVNLLAISLLLAGSGWASREAARDEAIEDARHAADLLATLLVEPALQDGVVDGDAPALAALDAAVAPRLEPAGLLRVKLWTADGRIVWSDEPRLIGMSFPRDEDDREALTGDHSRAEVSDLARPENRFERSAGRLLEVYRMVRTPGGQRLLLEAYSPYRDAAERERQVWWRFAPISLGAMLVLLALQLPLARRTLASLRAAQRERERLQERALDASQEERRRIAGSLHDGVVQDVSAASLLVATAADQLREESARPPQGVAPVLDDAAVALRGSVGSLRSLLVEIHPPSLARAGLAFALRDLATRLGPRGVAVDVRVPDPLDLPLETATLLFRTTQEALRNVARHSRARRVEVVVRAAGPLVLEVVDDGVGFDVGRTPLDTASGHLGLQVLADLAVAAGARLEIRSAPGLGTRLRLTVTAHPPADR